MNDKPIHDDELDAIFAPLSGHAHWGLAVSGGGDSTALMLLAARWRARQGGSPRLSVITVDHRLRDEAAGEARAVARDAAKLDLPHTTLRWEGSKPRTGIQSAAREARYDLLAGHAHGAGIDCVVSAHHLDDQAETVLMRLRRGSGLDGLSGIPAVSHWAGVPVVRPLLEVAGDRLRATLRAAGMGWAEDPGNWDDKYERARVRKAMPALEKLGCQWRRTR